VVRWLIEALVELGHVVTLLLAGIWRPGCAHDFRLPTSLASTTRLTQAARKIPVRVRS